MTIKISNDIDATHNDNPEEEEEVECEESEDGDLEQEVQLVVEDEGAAGHLGSCLTMLSLNPSCLLPMTSTSIPITRLLTKLERPFNIVYSVLMSK